MKAYRKPAGYYIELQDSTPVSVLLVQCAPRPSIGHAFNGDFLGGAWRSDPINPSVCWRLKTIAELDAEKVIECTSRLDNKIQRLLFEINFDQENRMRELERRAGIHIKPDVTKTQYRDALINVWKLLT